jgi:hypothetical protein
VSGQSGRKSLPEVGRVLEYTTAAPDFRNLLMGESKLAEASAGNIAKIGSSPENKIPGIIVAVSGCFENHAGKTGNLLPWQGRHSFNELFPRFQTEFIKHCIDEWILQIFIHLCGQQAKK